MSSDGEEESPSTPPDESNLRESVTTIAAAQLLRKSAKSPVSPVAVPLQQTEIIPVMMPPPAPVRTPPVRQKQEPPGPARNEVAKMEVELAAAPEKEEPPVAAPKRSWSSIVSVSAKNKSQKTKKNFQADVEGEKSVEEEKKGKKKGKKKGERRESPKKVVEEPLEEEEELDQVLPDMQEVVPVDEYLLYQEDDLPERALPELEEEGEVVQPLLLEEEELEVARRKEEMCDYMLRLAASEHHSEEEETQNTALDVYETHILEEYKPDLVEYDVLEESETHVLEAREELPEDTEPLWEEEQQEYPLLWEEEQQEYNLRSDDLVRSTIDDTEYVEAENEVPYFCISDRERVIDELEECESFYHDAHKAVQEALEEKAEPVEKDKSEQEVKEVVSVSEDPEVVECLQSNPVAETLAAAPADTFRRSRRQKKKRR